MVRRSVSIVAVLALTTLLGVTIYASKVDIATPANLTVHEWGTFTSVAGRDGKAVQWLPLAGPNDLPCFVEYFQNRLYKELWADSRRSAKGSGRLRQGTKSVARADPDGDAGPLLLRGETPES